MRTSKIKRLGYDPSEQTQSKRDPKESYVSPYKQPKLKPVAAVSYGKLDAIKKRMTTDAVCASNSNSKGRFLRHQTVDAMMARITSSKACTGTLTVPDRDLKKGENEQKAKVEAARVKRNKERAEENAEQNGVFLTGGNGGGSNDDDSMVSELSQESLGSLGSFGSFGSMASIETIGIRSKKSISGSTYRTFEVEMDDSSLMGGRGKRVDISLKAMLEDIKKRADESDLPPIYVPHLDELPTTMVSWNGKDNFKAAMALKSKRGSAVKIKKKNPTKNDMAMIREEKPRVDIIGMYQNVPLILARADERYRKQRAVLATKEHISEEKRKELMKIIKHKMSRTERYAEIMRIKSMQVAWLRTISILKYQAHLAKVRETISLRWKTNKKQIWAVNTLMFYIKRYIKRRLDGMIKNQFLKKIQTSYWILLGAIRTQRKRMAIKKIKYFFTLFNGKDRIKEVIHRFVRSAHLIQRAGRGFVAVHKTRISTIMKVWDRLEMQYIMKTLEKRKEAEKKTGIRDRKNQKNAEKSLLNFDEKTMIEMEKQAAKWRESEEKMDELLQKHRKAGTIPVESLHNDAAKLILPYELKYLCIQAMIDQKRRNFIANCEKAAADHAKSLVLYRQSDAEDLVKGNIDTLDRTVRLKCTSSAIWLRGGGKVFSLFSDKRLGDENEHWITETIKFEHGKLGTFHIKVRDPKERRKTMRLNKKAEEERKQKMKAEQEAAIAKARAIAKGTFKPENIDETVEEGK